MLPSTLQYEEDAYKIPYQSLHVGTLIIKPGLHDYIGEDAMPEGNPCVSLKADKISFRIRIVKTNCQQLIEIKDTDIIEINVCDVMDPGFLFIKTTSEKAREIRELTDMKRLFGPYLDPQAYEKDEQYVKVICSNAYVSRVKQKFCHFIDLYIKNSKFSKDELFHVISEYEAKSWLPDSMTRSKKRDGMPKQLARKAANHRLRTTNKTSDKNEASSSKNTLVNGASGSTNFKSEPMNVASSSTGDKIEDVSTGELPDKSEDFALQTRDANTECLNKSPRILTPDVRAQMKKDKFKEDSIRSDMINIMGLSPLCRCVIPTKSVSFNKDEPVKCMALDFVYGKIIGCDKSVSQKTPSRLYRSQEDKVAIACCEEHGERMIRHESCPLCGLFCTAGTIMFCIKCPDVPHRFHRDCSVKKGSPSACPHCGSGPNFIREIELKPGGEIDLAHLIIGQKIDRSRKKNYLSNRQRAARMIGNNSIVFDSNLERQLEIENKKISKSLQDGRIIDISHLPPGLDRSQLELIMKNLSLGKESVSFDKSQILRFTRLSDVKSLIEILVNAEDLQKYHETLCEALFIAYGVRAKHILYILLQLGYDINRKNSKGETLLYLAVKESNHEYVHFFLLHGADALVESQACIKGTSSFHLAAYKGDIKSLYLILLSQTIDLNAETSQGWTPFGLAATAGHLTTAEYLICQGADLQLFGSIGKNGFHLAVSSNNLEMVKLCLRKGCNPNIKTADGETALHIATRNGNYPIVTMLLGGGADPCILNSQGKGCINEDVSEDSMCWLAIRINKMCRELIIAPVTPLNIERTLCRDMSRGFARVPVSCVNAVDSEPCPACSGSESSFKYITKSLYVNNESQPNLCVKPNEICLCKDSCCVSPSKCDCVMSSERCWYDENGFLVPEFVAESHCPIYECTQLCRCDSSCRNRVVQMGMRYRLQVYRTSFMGWGLRSLDRIPKGAFICDYVGEVIPDSIAEGRQEDTYLFDIQNHHLQTDNFCVDANEYGNCSRFINHLCDANLYTIRVFTEHRDPRFPTLAFFSVKEIAPLEELGFDYGETFWDIKSKTECCKCGSPMCKYSKEAYDLKKKNKETSDDEKENEEKEVEEMK